MTALSRLFSPLRIGSMQLKNRLVMAPMTTDYGTDDQAPSRKLVDFLEARARGGVGLITLEACSVDRLHREVAHSLHFSDDECIEPHRVITQRVHEYGARIQPQIVHPGPDSLSPFIGGVESIGPSVAVANLTGMPCRELGAEEIEGLVEQFGAAAGRVMAAGYDGIELHSAHGYMLLGSFLSPLRNKRSDEYTAKSIEGRLKFSIAVIERMKRETAADFPITLRISGYERAPGGRPSADTQRMAPLLVEAGIDAFHISGGVSDRLVSQIVTGSHWGTAHNLAAAQAVKNVVDVPVMVVGRIHDPRLGEQILERGQADLIVMGRPLLADPELPNKAARGRLGDIRSCISCENCIDSMERGVMNCAVNAAVGREGEFDTGRAPRAKKVIVVGGGPGGLEAARVAALRGHTVTLYERQPYLGGALVLASAVHAENESFLDYLLQQVGKLPIELRLGEEATPELLAASGAEALIVATGGRVKAPRIPGDDLPHVLSGPLLRRMLAARLDPEDRARLPAWQRLGIETFGRRAQRFVTPGRIRRLTRLWMPLGRRVVILGADLVAVELAEFLAERGRNVSLLEPGSKMAPEVGKKRRTEHMDRLDRLGVSLNTCVECREIRPEGVLIQAGHGPRRLVAADSVIVAGGLTADTALFDAVKGTIPECHAVGDCTGPGLIPKATEEAMRVACSL